MQRTTPPFRADHVGSLLRTAALKEARAKRMQAAISEAELMAVEDREIESRDQEAGERRSEACDGRRIPPLVVAFRFLPRARRRHVLFDRPRHPVSGVQTKAEGVKITGKIGFSGHPMLEHFKFLKAHTSVTPKMTIPAPSTLHFRQGRASVSKEVYPDLEAFFDDVAKA